MQLVLVLAIACLGVCSDVGPAVPWRMELRPQHWEHFTMSAQRVKYPSTLLHVDIRRLSRLVNLLPSTLRHKLGLVSYVIVDG